ncbi:hypothetical protein GC176_14085 [bacterium]|nr:hypothetical protein [bacterium]
MGRLVKSPANQARAERRQFDEERFLRDAGALASRLQNELQQGSGSADHSASGRHSPMMTELAETLDDVAARDLPDPQSGDQADIGPTDADLGIASGHGADRPQRLRVFAPEDEIEDGESAASKATTAVEDRYESVMPRSEVRNARDQFEREREQIAQARIDLQEEQRRWAARHAQQTRQLEQQLAQIDEWKLQLVEREQALSEAERDQKVRLERQFRDRQAEVHSETQQLLDQCSTERAELAGEIERLQQELDRRSREHAREVTELRAQLENSEDERTVRRLQVIEECDRRMAELTEEKQSLAELRRRTEDEVAAGRAAIRQEQREWERRLADHRQELRDQTETHERRLAQERAEFQSFVAEETASINAAHRELQAAEQKHAAFVASEKRQLEQERVTLRESVERLQVLLQQRRQEHEQQLQVERQQLMEESDRLRVELREEIEQIRCEELRLLADERSEAESFLDAAREQIEQERTAWHGERGEEAAILKQALQQLESDREALQAELAELESRRQASDAELIRQHEEHSEKIAAEREEHERAVARAEREFADRRQILEQRIAQQEIELQARRERLEHEIKSMHELHERRLVEDRREFEDQCDRRREDLASELDEVRSLRDELDNERRDFEHEVARVRSQLEHERTLLRNGLNQMDAQLRMLSTSLGTSVPESRTLKRSTPQNLSHRHAPPDLEGEVEFLDQVQQPSPAHASAPPKRSPTTALQKEAASLIGEFPFETQDDSPRSAEEVSLTEWLGLATPDGPLEIDHATTTPTEMAERRDDELVDRNEAEFSDDELTAASPDVNDEPEAGAHTVPIDDVDIRGIPDVESVERAFDSDADCSDLEVHAEQEDDSLAAESEDAINADAGLESDGESAAGLSGVAHRIDAAQSSPRRQLLDRYRSQLGDLQAQLAELSTLRSPESGGESQDVGSGE